MHDLGWERQKKKKNDLSKRRKINMNGHEESEVKKTKTMTEREWDGIQGKRTAATEANGVTEEHSKAPTMTRTNMMENGLLTSY